MLLDKFTRYHYGKEIEVSIYENNNQTEYEVIVKHEYTITLYFYLYSTSIEYAMIELLF